MSNAIQSVRSTYILGDPTLRLALVKPPGTPTAALGGGGVKLEWAASDTANLGYWVYSSANLTIGDF